jgi:hypothetical protein
VCNEVVEEANMVLVHQGKTVDKELQLVHMQLVQVIVTSKVNLGKSFSGLEGVLDVLKKAKIAHQLEVACLLVYIFVLLRFQFEEGFHKGGETCLVCFAFESVLVNQSENHLSQDSLREDICCHRNQLVKYCENIIV